MWKHACPDVHTQCQWRINHGPKCAHNGPQMAQILEIQLLEKKSWWSYIINLAINITRGHMSNSRRATGKILSITWLQLMGMSHRFPEKRWICPIKVTSKGTEVDEPRWTSDNQDWVATVFYKRSVGQNWVSDKKNCYYATKTKPTETVAMMEKEPEEKLLLIILKVLQDL